jgi:hypothetical protein
VRALQRRRRAADRCIRTWPATVHSASHPVAPSAVASSAPVASIPSREAAIIFF